MPVFGIDVARYQGAITWPTVAGAGITFATIKASEGTQAQTSSATRDYFRTHLPRARTAGLLVGGYHVLRSSNVAAQVDWFLRQLGSVGGHRGMIVQLDYEKWDYDFPPWSALTGWLAEWRRRTDNYPVALYLPDWVYGQIPGRGSLISVRCPIWSSEYGSNPTGNYRSLYPGNTSPRWHGYGGVTPTILQYGSRTHVPGVPTGCDANAYRGTRSQLTTLLTGDDMTPDERAALIDKILRGSLTPDNALYYWLRGIAVGYNPLSKTRAPLTDPHTGRQIPGLPQLGDKLTALDTDLDTVKADLAALREAVDDIQAGRVDPAALAEALRPHLVPILRAELARTGEAIATVDDDG